MEVELGLPYHARNTTFILYFSFHVYAPYDTYSLILYCLQTIHSTFPSKINPETHRMAQEFVLEHSVAFAAVGFPVKFTCNRHPMS